MNRPDFSQHHELLRAMAAKYIWWGTLDDWDEFPERVVAQVMRYAAGGEGEAVKSDQALIERELGRDALRYIILNAEPGWFADHAWVYWHNYLGLAEGGVIPPLPIRHIPLGSEIPRDEPTPTHEGKPWPRIRDLPLDEQEPFRLWLRGRSTPYLGFDEVPDGYWPHDYQRWKRGSA